MRALSTAVLAATLFLVFAPLPAGAAGISAKRAVIAVLADDLFLGEAEGYLNGSGTLVVRSQKNPALTCSGQFTSSAETGGSGQMTCSDGTTAEFRFQRLTVFRGHGTGNFGQGSMSFVYGISAAESGPYLKLPSGRKLVQNGTELVLN